MKLMTVICFVSLSIHYFSPAMEKPLKPVAPPKKPSYLQRLPPDLWGELFLYMSQPGKILDNRGDVIMQTHAKARTIANLAFEYMNIELKSKKKLNENFIRASEAYFHAYADRFFSFYLPNEISLACALRTPGSRQLLREELSSMMQNFNTMTQRDKNKIFLDVMRRCPSRRIVSTLLKNGAQVTARSELSNYPALRYAVEDGKLPLVRTLLRYGALPDLSDRQKTNSLMRAVILGHEQMVALLAPKTNAINAVNLFGHSALFYAARRGSIPMITSLVNSQARVLRSDEGGTKNVFVAAVDSGVPEVLDVLLDVDEPDGDNGFLYDSFLSLAFKHAAELGNAAMVKVFINKAAHLQTRSGFRPTLRPDATQDDGHSALTVAIDRDHTQIAIELIKFAQDRYYKGLALYDDARSLAIAWAVSKLGEHSNNPELVKRYQYIISLMITDEDMPNPLGNKSSCSACFYAAYLGNEELLNQLLIVASARVDHGKERALSEAVEKLSVPAVRTILKTNPDVNWVNDRGQIIFWQALDMVNRQNLEIFDLLCAAGADVSKTDLSGITPVHIVMSNEDSLARLYMIDELHTRSAEIDSPDVYGDTPLLLACAKKVPITETAELLLQYGANPNHGNLEGNTPLILATSRNNQALVESLLRFKANPNKKNNSGCGPLTKVARVNNPEMCKILVRAGARVDDFKDGMLREAAKSENLDLMTALIHLGANINGRSSSVGNTPLHKAVIKQKANAIKLLLSKNANPKIKNLKGETPLELSLAYNDSYVCQLLTEHG